MKRLVLVTCSIAALTIGVLAPSQANAAGCLSGAAVGGVAGHVAGHHGLLGAAAGCAIGHHRATVRRRDRDRDRQIDTDRDRGGRY